jgi:serine/threonine-protein kinase
MIQALETALQARALEVFSASLDLPETQRRDWIEQQCADAPAVREAALRLLSGEGDGGDFLDRQPIRHEPLDRSGEVLGKYRLLERIGGGGMGTVYRAERADGSFEQQVAIKLIRHGLISDELLDRFYAERQILARLEHPGIARLIDGGADTLGMPYVVMEFVEGLTIDEYCERQRLDLDARLLLLQRICEALHAAHLQGVIHRDLKPGNLLVNQRGQPKLLDFGIAKVLQCAELGTPLPHTRTGMQAMTPQYASPEQVRGEAVDARSDVYALGVLMYELLTGSRPYHIDNLSPGALERTVCDTLPPNPSTAVIRLRKPPPAGLGESGPLSRRLRGDLDRIVMSALRKRPTERYASAQALADDIDRYLSGQPVLARGASWAYRGGKFIARHRVGAAALCFAFVTLAGALVAVSLEARKTALQRDLAQAQAARAESARAFLVEMIGRADPFENPGSATLVGALKQSIDSIPERFADQPALEADMRYAIGYALQNLGEYEAARPLLERALALREQLGDRIEQARVLDGLAIVHWWQSDFSAGEAKFRAALELLDGLDDPAAIALRIEILTNLAGMLSEPGEHARAVEYAQAAIELAQRHPDGVEAVLATAYNNLATAQESLGQYDAALLSFERALDLRRQIDGEMHPDYAIALNNLAFLHAAMDRLPETVQTFQRTVEIERQILAPQHPELASGLMNLSWAQTRLGDYQAAETNALEALAICRAGYADNHPRTGKAEQTLASLYLASGRMEQAIERARNALAIYSRAEEVNPSWVQTAEEILAQARAEAEAEAEVEGKLDPR